jgi:hypothetical protein
MFPSLFSRPKAVSKRRVRPLAQANRRRLWLEILEHRCLLSATPLLTTDQADYNPGDTAVISGTGFAAGENVTLQVLHTAGDPAAYSGTAPFTAQADA